jgi:hypothetical protein
MHGRKGRVGSVVLGGFGLALALLMIYTLVFEGTGGCAATGPSVGQVDVAVFFLERDEWRIFARGVAACVDEKRRLGRLVSEEDDAIIVETANHRRRVRFDRHGVRGEGQERDELRELAKSATPPIAVIGSSNTVLTAALARQLEEGGKAKPGGGPILLVPWATSVFLMDLYPGRTLRFCSNNRREAGLLVDSLKVRPGQPGPRQVFLAIDPLDPYSVELGAFFREEIGRAYPRAEFLDLHDGPPSAARPRLSGTFTIPTAIEQRRAKAIWRAVTEGPSGETWVVLPMQLEPVLRMLAILNGASPGRYDAADRPLTVICGDAVGQTTLAALANQLVFPVWSVSTASDHAATQRLEGDIREQAEIVAALLIALDRADNTPTPDALLALLKTPGGDVPPAPFGRPLAFTRSGEREGYEPGEVLNLEPDSPTVFVRDPGRRLEPRPADAGGPP